MQNLYKKPLYDAGKDFQPVALLAEVPLVLIVRKDLPVNNFKEFVAYAKKNQDKMPFGSSGVGAAVHLGTVLLNSSIGTNITHVPYRGSAPAMQDLQGGRIDYMTRDRLDRVAADPGQRREGDRGARAAARSRTCPTCRPRAKAASNVEAYTWNAIFLPNGHARADREEAATPPRSRR